MKFSVPTNFDDNLILIMDKREVYEVYGKLPMDFIGGSVAAYRLPSADKMRLCRHVDRSHKAGLKFNYLLNSVCLGNREWSIPGQKKLRHLLEWLTGIGVDAVTVSVPYLLQLAKKYYPALKVKASVGAGIDNVSKAKYWEDLGADLINLDCCGTCRNFSLLTKIRRSVSCELQLVANDACLYWCPLRRYHFSMNAHASQSGDESRGASIEYCALNCRYLRLSNISNFIRAIWIRPEDLCHYEAIGIDSFKFVDRTATTDVICRIVSAYTGRHYEGNLLDLLVTLSRKDILTNKGIFLRGIRYFLRPFYFNPLLIYKLSKARMELAAYIDNRALDGFIEHFKMGKCKDGMCQECGYCQRTAEKVIKIDKDYREKILLKYKDALDALTSKQMCRVI